MRRRLLLSYKNVFKPGYPIKQITITGNTIEHIVPIDYIGTRAIVYNPDYNDDGALSSVLLDLISYFEENYLAVGNSTCRLQDEQFTISFFDEIDTDVGLYSVINIHTITFFEGRITIFGRDENDDLWHGIIYTEECDTSYYEDYGRSFSFLRGAFMLQQIQPLSYGVSMEEEHFVRDGYHNGNRLTVCGRPINDSERRIKLSPLVGIMEYFLIDLESTIFSFYVHNGYSEDLSSYEYNINYLERDELYGHINVYGYDIDGTPVNGKIFCYDEELSIGSFTDDDEMVHLNIISPTFGQMVVGYEVDVDHMLGSTHA